MSYLIKVIVQLNKRTRGRQPRDCAVNNITWLVFVCEFLPGVWFKILNRERQPSVLGVDTRDNRVSLLTLLENLTRMLYSSRPRDVGHVNKSINAIFYLNKCAEVSQITHAAMNTHSDLISFMQRLPRILLNLLHSKTNTTRLGIDTQYFNLYRVSWIHNLAWMLNALGPTHLGNVNETFDAIFQLYESAVVCNACNLSTYTCAHWKSLFNARPRIRQ